MSIRPGWFYHKSQDKNVRSPANLVDLYYKSVGRGASLLLSLPPDRRGQIHDIDVKSLQGFKKIIDATFTQNLAKKATATASNVRGQAFTPANVLDGQRDTYWSCDDDQTTPELVLDLGKRVTFNVVSLREFLPLGQRIEDWALDMKENGRWKEFARGSAIGPRRLWRGANVTTDSVRLRITKAPVCPAISEFTLHLEPEWARKSNPELALNMGLPKGKWKAVSASYAEPGRGRARNAIDNNLGTFWSTHGKDGERPAPQELVLDLGAEVTTSGFIYTPRPSPTSGIVDEYAFYVSDDGKTWGAPVAKGEFSNILANPIQQEVSFGKKVTTRYVKFVALHSADKNHVVVAEIGLLP